MNPSPFTISYNFLLLAALAAVAGYRSYHGLFEPRLALFVFVLTGWLMTLCLHEFGHAVIAYYGGDDRVQQHGYLSLDPLKYTHPALSIMLPLVILAMGGIGLPGGAVYIRTSRLRSPVWVSAVSAAGPAMTLLCLLALCLPIWLDLEAQGGTRGFWAGVSLLAFLQLTALLFNLLPIPGLDGFGIIEPWLPPSLRDLAHTLRSGPIFLTIIVLFLLTPVGDAFFGFLFDLAERFGLYRDDVLLGLRLFQFWR